MQNTVTRTCPSSAGPCGKGFLPAFDLMIPRQDAMLPVIFLKREIPEILPRILREYERLTSEVRVFGRLSGPHHSRCPAPLISWYGSVLGNVYESAAPDPRSRSDACFALSCVLFTPEEDSGYCYAALDLPPLWDTLRCGLSPGDRRVSPIRRRRHSDAGRDPGKDRRMCRCLLVFRLDTGTGIWYAGISRRSGMKNVFSRYIGANHNCRLSRQFVQAL